MTIEDALGQERLPTRLRQRLLTRSVILKAAADEIAERGLEGVRIGEIAQRAGVTRPTIYKPFPTRSAFLREFESRTQATLLVELRSRLARSNPAPLGERLVDALFDLLEETHPVLRREVLGLVGREPTAADWIGNPLYVFLSEHLTQAQERGEITSALPAQDLTRLVVTALFGFLAVEAESAEDRRQAARQAIDLMLREGTSMAG
ncbi:TetR/AcrR family transcriptional regulator [Myxococcota bacterium]|nr:TetR/AcrR family transcriptional regulator [Myxococcota bacterium]